MHRFLLLSVWTLAACEVSAPPFPQQSIAVQPQHVQKVPSVNVSPAFASVTRSVEPVAENMCRARTSGTNCDFLIRIDPDPNASANAYQSRDRSGRPVITFNRAMLAELSNRDELAFVMSHEAAHHIRGHLDRQESNTLLGVLLAGGLVAATGADDSAIDLAQDIGGAIGSRSFSKQHELEADQLGTIITHQAGYRPSVGVLFFNRLPDPGDQFLGTHPANHDRVQVVQQTIQTYGLN